MSISFLLLSYVFQSCDNLICSCSESLSNPSTPLPCLMFNQLTRGWEKVIGEKWYSILPSLPLSRRTRHHYSITAVP